MGFAKLNNRQALSVGISMAGLVVAVGFLLGRSEYLSQITSAEATENAQVLAAAETCTVDTAMPQEETVYFAGCGGFF